MENVYVNYEGKIQINMDTLIVSMWNKVGEDKIYLNDEKFFNAAFASPYDAAKAAAFGDYRSTDKFVYCCGCEGFLMSFTGLDDDTCPIDMDKIDISSLINMLRKLQKLNKGYVDNIPEAIHDALQEV